MMFNINENVRVKLTEYGRQLLEREHYEFWGGIGRMDMAGKYIPPKEDEEGWSTWQMWDLMVKLGKHIKMTAPQHKQPFELEIDIRKD